MQFKRRFWMFLGLWVIAASAVALLLGSLNWLDYYRLTRSGIETVGHVTRKEPNKHLTVHYRYLSKVGYVQGVGAQVILVYDSEFEKGHGIEQFLFQIRDGKAMLVRYDINSPGLKNE